MESAQATLSQPHLLYATYSTVNKVEERFVQRHASGFGDRAVFEKVSLGWYVHFNGSYEALSFGMEKPNFEVGDKIKITFARVS